jgi:hypothetical protein
MKNNNNHHRPRLIHDLHTCVDGMAEIIDFSWVSWYENTGRNILNFYLQQYLLENIMYFRFL